MRPIWAHQGSTTARSSAFGLTASCCRWNQPIDFLGSPQPTTIVRTALMLLPVCTRGRLNRWNLSLGREEQRRKARSVQYSCIATQFKLRPNLDARHATRRNPKVLAGALRPPRRSARTALQPRLARLRRHTNLWRDTSIRRHKSAPSRRHYTARPTSLTRLPSYNCRRRVASRSRTLRQVPHRQRLRQLRTCEISMRFT